MSPSSYRFALPSPNAILGLPIGQHISIGAELAQPDGSTKEIVRSYTPISGDHQPGYFDLLIKSYPTGNISKHMASMKVGQPLRVKGPKGAFVYTPNMVRHFGMIAGGTGITPMLQVVRAIIRGRAAGDRTQVDLIFANVTPQDILLKEDLDALAKEDSGFRVHYVLDQPPEGWTGGVGYVTGDMITVSFSGCLLVEHQLTARSNGSPSLPVMSRSCSAGPLPWSAPSRRPPWPWASRRRAPSASSRTRSLPSKLMVTGHYIIDNYQPIRWRECKSNTDRDGVF